MPLDRHSVSVSYQVDVVPKLESPTEPFLPAGDKTHCTSNSCHRTEVGHHLRVDGAD